MRLPLLSAALLFVAAPAFAADPLTPPPLPPVDTPAIPLPSAQDPELAPPPRSSVQATAENKVDEKPMKAPALRVGVGPRFQNRSFTWAANGVSPYPDYVQGGDFAMGMGATWFPGAHFTTGPAANVGLQADGVFAMGSTSSGKGNTWGNHSQRLRAGAIVRVPMGRHLLDVDAGVLWQGFDIDARSTTGLARPQLPNVDLTALRAGLGVHLGGLGAAIVTLRVEGLLGLGFGEIASTQWYGNTSGGGVGGQLAVTVPLVDNIELKIDGDFARYFLGFNTPATATVQGAADQYLGFGAALTWAM